MSTHLVTGYAGKPHVTANDAAFLNRAIFGDANVVVGGIGREFAYEIQSNNLVRIFDGVAVMEGRQVQIDAGTYEDAAIDNGSAGLKRQDLICLRYSKASGTGVETCSLVVLKGTAASSANDPGHPGSVIAGNAIAYFPLYRVKLDGINITEVQKLFTTYHNRLISMPVINSGPADPNDNDGNPVGSFYFKITG